MSKFVEEWLSREQEWWSGVLRHAVELVEQRARVVEWSIEESS